VAAAGLSAVLVMAGCAGGRAARNDGKVSEHRRDYDAALKRYAELYDLHPDNSEDRMNYERARFAASFEHFNRGRQAMEVQDWATAEAEFQRAFEIDPSNAMTRSELIRVKEILSLKSRGLALPPITISQMREASRTDNDPRAVLQPKVTGPIPIIRMNQGSRQSFETLCELAGLTCVFHRQFANAAAFQFTVENADIYTALDLLAFQTGNFWQVNDPHTIIVATDNPTVRREVEPMIMKTIYLANITRQQEVTELVTALRTLLSLSQIAMSTPMNAIMLWDTANKVALAETIVSNFDRPKSEVIVDVIVLEVDRNELRQLGILPPQGTSLTFQQTGVLPTTTTPGPSEMMLNNPQAFSSSHFSVAIPQTLAQFLANSNHTKLLQSPTIRATDGLQASLRIGTREPVASGSFQNTAATQNAVVQFQFVDVGVNLDITPRVLLNRDVELQATVVVSAHAGDRQISGVLQPIFTNRSITHQVRLMEGETNMLGGIMSETEFLTESGIPWLKDLPGPFGYFFSQKRRQQDSTEIIIMMTPRIVRMSGVTVENMCGYNTGSFANPTLRGVDGTCGTPTVPRGAGPGTPAPAPAGNPPPTPAPGAGRGAALGNPPPPLVPPAPAVVPPVIKQAPGATNITISPVALTLTSDSTVNVNVNVNGGQNLSGAELTFQFDPAAFSIEDARDGGFFSVNNVAVSVIQAIDTKTGIAIIKLERATGTAPSPGNGNILTLALKRGSKKGTSALRLTEARLREGVAPTGGAQTFQLYGKPAEAQVTVP
jgi:general secretion pathway protein D